jgi:hypothetical protein
MMSQTSKRGRALAAFIGGGVLGVAAGAAAMLIAYPFLFPPPVAADAAPVARAGAAPASTFRFDEAAPGRDPVHWADGSGSLIAAEAGWVLRLDANFKAGPGPNFWIYLNTRAVGDESDFLADAKRVRLAPLRAFEGAQNYLVPATIDPKAFHSVTVWCESFGAYIASGVLTK